MKIWYWFCLKNKINNENKIIDNNNLLWLVKLYCVLRDLEYWCLGKIMLKYVLVNIVYGE